MAERLSIAVRLPADLVDRLDAEAEARLISRNLIVTKAVEHYLAVLRPIDLEVSP